LSVVLVVLASVGWPCANVESVLAAIASRDADTIAHGQRLFAQNCSPCHGQHAVGENPTNPMGGWNLQVGPVAPALNGTGHAWHHEPEYLFQTVRNGSLVQGSRMRGWKGTMSDYDIVAVIAYFQSLWPPRLQQAYTHRYLHRVVREPIQPRTTGPISSQRNGLVPIGMLASLWGPTEDMLGARDALKTLGYQQNQHVAFGWRAAEGHEGELEAIATQLRLDGAQILYASDVKALAAVQRVNSDTPIVFTSWYNPGVASLGAQVRGVIPAFPEGSPQSLEVLQALLPTLTRVLLPYDASDPELQELLSGLRATASRLGITLVERAIRTRAEARQVIMGARKGEVDAILPVGGRWNIAGYALQANLQHHLPALFCRGWMAEYGGLVSYGPSWYGFGQHAGRLIADLLRGVTPDGPSLQVVQDMELVINLRTAQALGITVPPSVLEQATRVIE
jgi:putative ABC transport system substrate-binding protein